MSNLIKKYRETVNHLSKEHGFDLTKMEPFDVCDRLELLGFEHIHPTLSKDIDAMFWVVDNFGVKKEPKKKKNKKPKIKKRRVKKHKTKFSGFYGSEEWRQLRLEVFALYGKKCLRCGKKKNIHVDHIFPRSRYPQLELDIDNLQPLCKDCNEDKLNRHYWDYRPISNKEKLKLLSKVGCDDLEITKPP